MYSPRTYTIVVVSFDSVGRVDLLFDKSNNSVDVVHAWQMDRPERAELAEAVTAGLGLGAKECGRVYVLTNEFWSGQVSLSDEIVNAVTEDQLEQTLALEAEFETGISPFASRLGHVLVTTAAGPKTWWVTQAESNQLEAIETAVLKWAGNLSGISSTTICMPTSEDGNEDSLDARSSDACVRLAQRWLTKYLADRSALPVIHMTSLSWAEQNRGRISVLIALGVLAVCVAFHISGTRQLARANTELSELTHQEKQLRRTFDEGEKLSQQVREVKRQREANDKAQAQQLAQKLRRQAEYEAKKNRPVQLLRALLSTAGQDHFVRSIELDHEQAVISGLALDSTSVTTLSQRIECELDPSKWLVKRANISFAETRSLVRYEITIVPRTVDSPDSPLPAMGAADVPQA